MDNILSFLTNTDVGDRRANTPVESRDSDRASGSKQETRVADKRQDTEFRDYVDAAETQPSSESTNTEDAPEVPDAAEAASASGADEAARAAQSGEAEKPAPANQFSSTQQAARTAAISDLLASNADVDVDAALIAKAPPTEGGKVSEAKPANIDVTEVLGRQNLAADVQRPKTETAPLIASINQKESAKTITDASPTLRQESAPVVATNAAAPVQSRTAAPIAPPRMVDATIAPPELTPQTIEAADIEAPVERIKKPVAQTLSPALFGMKTTPAFMAAPAFAIGPTDAVAELSIARDAITDGFLIKPFGQSGASLQAAQISLAATAPSVASTSPAAQLVAAVRSEKIPGVFEVRLEPPELGRVRIEFATETADAVRAVVAAERSETLDYMRRNVNELLEELKAAGFSSINLEFSGENSAQFDDDEGFAETASNTLRMRDEEARDVIYLSLREDASLNVLV